ncbi:hypothetical protein CPB83DRAFT_898211 [Crepidotus variabilis]|uniref:SH3 domain-containing protein n=1 Tax=Crepidotus variabilis TaxID=179855 RepID=A0A9P6E7T0_9AGAR|nr:hypothetical protein CPB83DRAFT_898211 [Crepidotus variabilis]
MKFSNPLTPPLPKECLKAAKIFRSFVDENNNGLDGLIPREVLANAKGFAIITVLKAGVLVSARGGSGVVIVKLDTGAWSAPSAIGIAGLGFGGQFGAEMTDIVIVLNSRAAINAFMAAGSLTLGGSMGLAIGPTGRNSQLSGAVNSSGAAAMYSYSRSRGLFGGVSIEGSVIIERQDTNKAAYGSPVTVRMLLNGTVKSPAWALPLVEAIETCTCPPTSAKLSTRSGHERSASFLLRRKQANRISFPPSSWGAESDNGSYFTHSAPHLVSRSMTSAEPASSLTSLPSVADSLFESNSIPSPSLFPGPSQNTDAQPTRIAAKGSSSRKVPYSSTYIFTPPPPIQKSDDTSPCFPTSPISLPPQYQSLYLDYPSLNEEDEDMYASEGERDGIHPMTTSVSRHELRAGDPVPGKSNGNAPQQSGGPTKVLALFDFEAHEDGDLSFKEGDIIEVTRKSDNTDDWWKGKTVSGHEGIFPANYVKPCN